MTRNPLGRQQIANGWWWFDQNAFASAMRSAARQVRWWKAKRWLARRPEIPVCLAIAIGGLLFLLIVGL
jgi:hypothetical protein